MQSDKYGTNISLRDLCRRHNSKNGPSPEKTILAEMLALCRVLAADKLFSMPATTLSVALRTKRVPVKPVKTKRKLFIEFEGLPFTKRAVNLMKGVKVAVKSVLLVYTGEMRV